MLANHLFRQVLILIIVCVVAGRFTSHMAYAQSSPAEAEGWGIMAKAIVMIIVGVYEGSQAADEESSVDATLADHCYELNGIHNIDLNPDSPPSIDLDPVCHRVLFSYSPNLTEDEQILVWLKRLLPLPESCLEANADEVVDARLASTLSLEAENVTAFSSTPKATLDSMLSNAFGTTYQLSCRQQGTAQIEAASSCLYTRSSL